jgi:hypothetical protein
VTALAGMRILPGMETLIVGSVHPACESMSASLTWEVPPVQKNLGTVERCIRDHLNSLPETHIAVRDKMERWLDRFVSMRQGIAAIRHDVQPLIERDLGYELENRELVVVAMIQPSTKNLFTEIETHFRSIGGCVLPSDDLLWMARLAHKWGLGAAKSGVANEQGEHRAAGDPVTGEPAD